MEFAGRNSLKQLRNVQPPLHRFSQNAQLLSFCVFLNISFETFIIKISREENKIRAKIHLRL